MDEPHITDDMVEQILETKFVNVFDLHYPPGKHYYDVTRRQRGNLTALMPPEKINSLLPDAVTCYIIIRTPGQEPRLLLAYEYRYPAGQYLLSPPAGLIDKEDKARTGEMYDEATVLNTARREIHEETGLELTEKDRVFVVSPLVYSTPGMTDESNALICAVIDRDDLSSLTQSGAVGSERFDGFQLVSESQARELIRQGRDKFGHYYPMYTFGALVYFAGGFWKDAEKE